MANRTDKRRNSGTSRPAEGERRATIGYKFQYQAGAKLVYDNLTNMLSPFEWIRVADPDVGRVDDLQIGSTSRVDGFQMKGSQFPSSFTFRALTYRQKQAPPLIAQLADGWKRLSEQHPAHRVVVHLVTNDIPSSSDSLPADQLAPTPNHFAAFMAQVWTPMKTVGNSSDWSCPHLWQKAWDTLRKASGLQETEFGRFAQDCELDFNVQLPSDTVDLNSLRTLLFDTAASPQRLIQLAREDLLKALNWENRYQFRSRHEFRVDQTLYQPIEESIEALEQAFNSLQGGYLSVIGPPGSGKSTLLTQSLRPRADRRVIRYYAYVPDAQDPASVRGESVNFLHDITLAIERAGFGNGSPRQTSDRNELLQRLHRQLLRLGDDWKQTGHITILLVDGLDHVERELHPRQSFLADLPLPNQVPDGVFFVLGSQTDQLSDLPDRVQQDLRQPNRRVEIANLRREAVHRIIDAAALQLDSSQKERVFSLSAGHPLALNYILNQLRGADTQDRVISVLDVVVPYQGDIKAQYEIYWNRIKHNVAIADLLGLLARIRRVIDMGWVALWADYQTLEHLSEQTAHYFRIEGSRWQFFHNSFRLFVLDKTAELLGSHNVQRDQHYHTQLAGYCAAAPSDSLWAWEELYHRVQGGQNAEALALATQERFRSQLYALRPAEAILTDIRVALRAAAATQDAVALARLMLAGAEIADRDYYMDEQRSAVSLLLTLGERETALEALRDGNHLRVGIRTAMRLCAELIALGLQEESRHLFELAQPLDIIDPSAPPLDTHRDRDKIGLLSSWAQSATHFKPISEVVETLRRIQEEPDRSERLTAEQASRLLQNYLLLSAGEELTESERWDDLKIVLDALDPSSNLDHSYWLGIHVRIWRHLQYTGNLEGAARWLRQAIALSEAAQTDFAGRIAIAEGVFRILGDSTDAEKWIEGLSEPPLPQVIGIDAGISPFLQQFRLRRLQYALGDRQDLTEVVPDAARPDDQGMVYFRRAVCSIAHLWGEAWRGNSLDTATILQRVHGVVKLFHRDHRSTRSWSSWYVAEQAREEFYPLLVEAVALHGPDQLKGLCDLFTAQWQDPATAAYWPADVTRAIIRAALENGQSRTWVVEQLELLETRILAGQDVTGRVKQCSEQAHAWVQVDEVVRARNVFQQAMRVSFGVGYRKDYQIGTWIKWLRLINEEEPQHAGNRIAWFARAIVTLEETTEGKAAHYAATALLRACLRWSPQCAVHLFQWFHECGVVWHADALCALLKEGLETDSTAWNLTVDFLADLVLPICTTADPALASLTIERASEQAGSIEAMKAARRLADAVALHSLPSTRREWRYGIALGVTALEQDLTSAHLSDSDLQTPPDHEVREQSLGLQDGTRISSEELRRQVTSLESVLDLMRQQSPSDRFDWGTIVSTVTAEATQSDISRMLDDIPSHARTTDVLNAFALRLNSLAEAARAWELGKESLDRSNHFGWVRWYDGGTRLSAAQTLVQLDQANGRALVFDQLAKDIGTGQIPFRNVAEGLEDIFPLLTDTLPIAQVWPCVEEYVLQLFHESSLPEDDLSQEFLLPASENPNRDSMARAIADLTCSHFSHPIFLLAESAQRISFCSILNREQSVHSAIRNSMAATEAEQEVALIVLDAVSLKDAELIVPYQDLLQKQLSSPNSFIREMATLIALRGGISALSPQTDQTPMPAIYQVDLTSTSTTRMSGAPSISESEPLPDTRDPFELLSPFDHHLGFIAHESGVPKENLVHRAAQIMRDLDSPSNWSLESSRKQMEILQSSALRFPFRRRRPQIARRATFHVTQELIQFRKLTEKSVARISALLRHHDPEFVLRTPSQRGTLIAPIPGLGEYGARNNQWLERIEDALSPIRTSLDDERMVLAEHTTLKNLDWSEPTETRQSNLLPMEVVVSVLENQDEERSALFYSVDNCRFDEYPSRTISTEPMPIILRNTTFFWDTPGGGWLALNPMIGQKLQWKPSIDGLFRWMNKQGRIMVETIWWRDGQLRQLPPHLHDEVGEGWLVIASKDAVARIRELAGLTVRVVRVDRSYHEDGQRFDSSIMRMLD